jgi:hypothetical protein
MIRTTTVIDIFVATSSPGRPCVCASSSGADGVNLGLRADGLHAGGQRSGDEQRSPEHVRRSILLRTSR